jgi:hypothetical protein
VNLAPGACTEGNDSLDVQWDDGRRIFCRGWRTDDASNKSAVLVVLPAGAYFASRPPQSSRSPVWVERRPQERAGGAAA